MGVGKASNTGSLETYREFCVEHGATILPASMPCVLVEFFLKFLTDGGDFGIDPFGGSNITGAISEDMGQRWVSVEADWEHAVHSMGRFDPTALIDRDRELSILVFGEPTEKKNTFFGEDWSLVPISDVS